MTQPPDSGAPREPWDELNRLDVAVYEAIAATPTPAIDGALRWLSRAAS
jgi:hypothetical protein